MPSLRPAVYRSYLLRCWRERSGGRRFVLETVSELPERHGFERFEELVAYLRAELGVDTPADAQAPQADERA